jgi:hypothetical protein
MGRSISRERVRVTEGDITVVSARAERIIHRDHFSTQR